MNGKFGKTEYCLLAAAAVFAILLTAAFFHDRPAPGDPVTVETQYSAAASEIAPVPSGKINLNTAAVEELTMLPGIGEVLAQRIADYRTEHGAFEKIEDVMNVSGIGEGKFSDIAAEITVEEDAP
jgi:comEA protein